MSARKRNEKSAKKPQKSGNNGLKPLNLKNELFCQYYTNELFGNATLSYSAAYGIELLSLSRTHERDPETGKVIESEYKRKEAVCAVNGAKLLRIAKIDARIRKLIKARFNDDVVDTEHMKVIMQNEDRGAKMAGVREYNRVKGRVKDPEQQLPPNATPITKIQIIMPKIKS